MSMKIWILRILFGVGSVVLVAAFAAWWMIRGSLPMLDGELVVAGLDHAARIERDEQGIPTIRGSTRRDLALATGFVHGQDRFFQMDMIRRKAAGELSEMFGAAALPLDRHHRFHRFRARAQAVMQTLTATERAILDAYASGVNAGLGSLSARPFEYLLLREQPKPWRTEDTMLVVYAMFMQLNDDRARGGVQRGLAKSVLPANVYAWLYPNGTSWDAPLVGGAIETVPMPDAGDYAIRHVELGRWRTLLLEVLASGGREMEEYRSLVENWIPAASADSVGYRLVRAFRMQVRQNVFTALTTPVRDVHGEDADLLISHQFEAPLWSILTEKPRHLLPANFESWDALMLAAVRENIGSLETRFEGALSERTWGELNTAQIAHPISGAVPWLSGWLDMPREALPGDANLPLAQSPDFGASQRFSVSPGDEANGLMHMPTGQSGHPMSPFYRRGHEDWVSGAPSPFLPGPTRHRLTLKPAARL